MSEIKKYRKGDRVLGTYTVEDGPWEGGFGTVYKVWNNDAEYYRALKIPQREENFGGFIDECRNWIRLSEEGGTNIVKCYEVNRLDGVPCAMVEWMGGGDIGGWISDGRLYNGLGSERILSFARQTAVGLKFAQEKGFAHRDVKPSNIMIADDGKTVKVTDFGLASALKKGTGGQSSYASNVMGTTGYRSPEHSHPTKKITAKSDVYSWALTVLSMYLGNMDGTYCPWENGIVLAYDDEVREKYLNCRGKAAIPEPIGELLRQCMHLDSKDRPDFMEVIQIVDRCAGGTSKRADVTKTEPMRAAVNNSSPEEIANAMLPKDPVLRKVAETVVWRKFKEIGAVATEALKTKDPQVVINNGLIIGMDVAVRMCIDNHYGPLEIIMVAKTMEIGIAVTEKRLPGGKWMPPSRVVKNGISLETVAGRMLPSDPMLKGLAKAVVWMKADDIGSATTEALKMKSPDTVIKDGLSIGMKIVAKLYEDHIYGPSEIIRAGDTFAIGYKIATKGTNG